MEHTIDADRVHHGWDRALDPILTVDSGDVVHYDLRMAGHGQISEGDGYADARLDFDTLYHLSGPVFVRDAEPSDTLRIDILSLQPGDWGWASVLEGLGLLPDDFPEPWAGTFDLRRRGQVEIVPGIHIATSPFLGTMGIIPASLPWPPRSHPTAAGATWTRAT